MKKLFYFLVALLSIGFVVTSCSNDETIDANTPTTRSYDQDAEILVKFVDINKTEGQYFINDSKKISALSYITDKDWEELQKVNPANKTRFENDLRMLNNQLEAVAKRGDVSQIVYTTYGGKTWIRNISEDVPFMIERSNNVQAIATKANYNTMSILADGFTAYADFYAGRTIRSIVDINMFAWKYYFFEITCKIDATKTGPIEGGNKENAIVISGTGQHENYTFTWTAKGSETYLNWKFQGKMHSPSDDLSANVRVDFVD